MSRTDIVQLGRGPRGFEIYNPETFNPQVLRSSINAGWDGINAFTFEMSVLPEFRRFCGNESLVAGIFFRGGQNGFWKKGKHTQRYAIHHPGRVAVLPMGLDTQTYWDCGYTMMHVVISPKLIGRVLAEAFGVDATHIEFHLLQLGDDPVLFRFGELFDAELREGHTLGRLYIESLSQALMIHLAQHYAQLPCSLPRANAGPLTKHTIHRAQAFIQAHLDQSLSLAQIAEQVNLSAFHLTRLFKQTTGQALHQYVIAQRLERARQLIAQGKLPLKAVASQVGFADQSHLTRHFRRAFGITPRALMYEKHTHLHRLPDMPDSALDSKKEG